MGYRVIKRPTLVIDDDMTIVGVVLDKEVIPFGGGEGGTNNYALLVNKPSINGKTLIGNLSSEDLQIIDEYDVGTLIDDKTKEFIKDTNFASKEKAGVIKVNDLYDVNINANGDIFPSNLSLQQYKSKSSFSFIGKGTLENVLSDRIITKKDGSGNKYLNDKGEYTEVQGGGSVVLDDEMSDTSENGVKNKVIKGYIDAEIDDLRLAKYPNVTVIGSPVINGGQMSGFSSTDYARFPFLVDLTNKPFEINFDILTGTDVSNQQNIFDSDFGFAFAIRNSRFVIAMSSTGISWDIGEAVGTNVVLPNVQYKIRISWDTATYKVELSTNGGKSYVTDITKDSTASLYPTQIYIGVGENSGQVQNSFTGMIDFTKANLMVDNNVIIWVGLDVEGLETRLAKDVSNIDAAGEEKIRQIAGVSGIELTEEHKTGETFNGKPVYEKVVTFTTGSAINTVSKSIEIITSWNIDDVLSLDGMFRLSQGQRIGHNHYITSGDWSSIWIEADGKIAEMHSATAYSSITCIVKVKYTKTD